MQTRISIARVGPDAPGGFGTRSYGPTLDPRAVSIVNGFGREFCTYDEDGAFSLKWIPRGTARYRVDRVQHYLTGEKILVLQAGQPYEIEFLDRKGTESFCLFFPQSLVKETRADCELDDYLQFAARSRRRPDDLQFADMVFKPPVGVSSVLRGLRQSIDNLEIAPERLEETLLSLLDHIVAIADGHRRLAERVPARRPGTRRRLLSRLQRAREIIEDHEGRQPALEELARACALSKFHFLRLFRATFELAPMAYADQYRAERAKDLLRHSRLTIGQTAERLGFESQSAFAKMFRRHVGVTPRDFRAG
jgi:AraC-like DNA-binding protein